MYSMKNIDGKESNTEKGVNIETEFNEFKDTLFNNKIIRRKMKKIQGKKHKIGTYKINKSSLSCFDDKWFVLDDRIALAYFHKGVIFTRVILNKKRFKKMFTNKKDSHEKKRFSQIITNKNKYVQINVW